MNAFYLKYQNEIEYHSYLQEAQLIQIKMPSQIVNLLVQQNIIMLQDPQNLPIEIHEDISYQIDYFCQSTLKKQCWNFIQKVKKQTNSSPNLHKIPSILKEILMNLHQTMKNIFVFSEASTVSKIKSALDNIQLKIQKTEFTKEISDHIQIKSSAKQSIHISSTSQINSKSNDCHFPEEPTVILNKIKPTISQFISRLDQYLYGFVQRLAKEQPQKKVQLLQRTLTYFHENIVSNYFQSVSQVYSQELGNQQHQRLNQGTLDTRQNSESKGSL